MNRVKDIYLNRLRVLYDKLQRMKLPDPCQDQNMNDWVTRLIHIDASIAGLLATLIGHGSVDVKTIPNLQDLEKDLVKIYNTRSIDMFDECLNYLNLLQHVVDKIKANV